MKRCRRGPPPHTVFTQPFNGDIRLPLLAREWLQYEILVWGTVNIIEHLHFGVLQQFGFS